MNVCDSCGASVGPRWKFCLSCGNRMNAAQEDAARRRRFDWPLTVGIALALAGIAMIVSLVIVLVVPHA